MLSEEDTFSLPEICHIGTPQAREYLTARVGLPPQDSPVRLKDCAHLYPYERQEECRHLEKKPKMTFNTIKIIDLKHEPHAIPLLADWHHHEWASLNPGQTLEQRIESMQAYLSDELIPSTLIARGPQLMGSAAIVQNDMDTHPEWMPWLASVYVAPEFRHQGVGSHLVNAVSEAARKAGMEALYLFTPDRVAFYQRLEWQVLHEEAYRGHWVTVMRIQLR
jgi:N-acetylglutamate synthase-like GNAT family acetyltransferase